VSRDALLVDVWGYKPGLQTRAVDNTVRRLRKKVEADPAAPVHLQSVYGGGYLLEGGVPLGGADGPALPELVGRDSLIRDLEGAGRGLVGPVGVGKSALAAVVAGADPRVVDVEGRDAAGAWAALGVALGAPGRPGDVRSVLMHRGVALVVEGLAAGSAAATAVEDWGRRVRVCVPSRAPLALAGARGVAVPPLEPAAEPRLAAAGYPAALQRYAAWARVARAAAGRPPGPPVEADVGAAPFVGLVERVLATGLCTPAPPPGGPLDEDSALLLRWLAGRG
jgi:hypothetical protein